MNTVALTAFPLVCGPAFCIALIRNLRASRASTTEENDQ